MISLNVAHDQSHTTRTIPAAPATSGPATTRAWISLYHCTT